MNTHPKDERLYLALEQVLEEMSQSTRPQQKLTDELNTLLNNHYEEYGNRGEGLSDEIEVDIQFKHQDSPFDLTQKQDQAFQLCKKLTSEKDREKRFLVEEILSKGIYSSSHQAKKSLKLLLRVDKISLRSRGNKVRNTAD